MSFFEPFLHEQQQHAAFFEYSTAQGPLCLACFLHSLADTAQLDSRKVFVLREFVRVYGPEGPDGAEPLKQLLSQHASMLVNGLLTACTASCDMGLSAAVQEAAAAMCHCAPEYLPELLTDRILQLLLELPWPDHTNLRNPDPSTTLHPSLHQHTAAPYTPAGVAGADAAMAAAAVATCLSLLHGLVSAHPAAAQLCLTALARSDELGVLLCAGLTCPLDHIVTPLVQLFALLAGSTDSTTATTATLTSSSSGSSPASGSSCCLPPAVVRELFIQLLLLLPQLSVAELQELVLQLLLHLVSTGYAIEQASLSTTHQPSTTAALPLIMTPSQGPDFMAAGGASGQLHQQYSQQQQQQSAALAAAIMSGLKPSLLATNPSLQLPGCQLLSAAAVRAPAAVQQQLIAAEACEHLFEVLRGTLSSCSMSASILALQQQQQQQQRQGPAAAAAAVGWFSQVEDLQEAAVAALQGLAAQAPSFADRLPFGVDTLTALLSHSTATCNTTLQAAALALLHEGLTTVTAAAHIAGSSSGSNKVLPAASLGRLAAAAAAVLPEITPQEVTAAAAAGSGGGGGCRPELQPTAEQQQSHELACRLLGNLCMRYTLASTNTTNPSHSSTTTLNSSSSSNSRAYHDAVAPHILSAAHKALLLLSAVSSRALLGGLIPAVCVLVRGAVQMVAAGLTQTAAQTQQQQQQPMLRRKVGRKGNANSSNSSSSLGSKQRRGKQPAPQEKLFVRRAQQWQQQQQEQQQQQQQQQQALSQGLAGSPQGEQQQQEQQGLVDDVLFLVEAVLLHLMPAALRVWEVLGGSEGDGGCTAAAAAAGGGGVVGLWPSTAVACEQQHEVSLALFQGVVGLLLTVLDTGSSSPALAPFLPPFCHNLLSNSSWVRVCLDLLDLLPLTQQLSAQAWEVVLRAAAHTQHGAPFMTGCSLSSLPSLASSLSTRVTNRLQLLELLCTNSNTQQQQQQQQGSSRRSSSTAGGGTNGDIRRFCGVSDLHRAVLCVVAAALHCGDLCWALEDVLTALNAAVGQAGPAILSQPDLLLHVVRLYAAVEQQLDADLAALQQQQQQQQVLQLAAGGYEDTAGDYGSGLVGGRNHQQQQQQQPVAVLQALQRLSAAQLSCLHPSDAAAGWVLGRAAVLPGVVRLLLQQWMKQLLLLVTDTSAATAAGGGGQVPPGSQCQPQQQQQQELCSALQTTLTQHSTAVAAALQLLQDLLLDQQQQQLAPVAAWLALLTAILMDSAGRVAAASSNPTSGHNYQQQHVDDDIQACCNTVQLLLLGSQSSSNAAGAGSSSSGSGSSSGCCGLLQLSHRALVSCGAAGSWADSSNSSSREYTVLACCNCLTAAAAAVCSGAVAVAGEGGGGGGMAAKLEVERWLMQQASAQVTLLSSQLCQLHPHNKHPLDTSSNPLLLPAAASAAAAWLHSALVCGAADGQLLTALAGSGEVAALMTQAVEAALTPPQQHNLQQQQQHEQQQQQAQGIAGSALQWLLSGLYQQWGQVHPGGERGGGEAGGSSQRSNSSGSSPTSLLVPALIWDQHVQWLKFAGLLQAPVQQQQQQQSPATSSSSGGSSAGVRVCGRLTLLQALLLVQSQGPSLLSLLLLDNVTSALKQQQQGSVPGAVMQQGLSGETAAAEALPWSALLSVLQNVVGGAAVPGACSWQYSTAAGRALAALYPAAAAAAADTGDGSYSTGVESSTSAAACVAVLSSPWNAAVMQAALDRLSQKAGELQAVATAAALAAGAAAPGSSSSSSSGGGGGGYSWLCEADVQQHTQMWCADAELLLSYAHLATTTATSTEAAAGGTAGAGGTVTTAATAAAALSQLRGWLQPHLEQQLLSFLCWGAAQSHSCCLALLQETLQQQQQQQEGQLAYKAAACCLSMHLSGVCFSLLELLLQCGCLNSCGTSLKKQLQQQALPILRHQQQQQLQQGAHHIQPGSGPSSSAAAAAAAAGGADAGLQGFAAQCVEAGAVGVLSPLLLLEGCAVGRLQGPAWHVLLQAYCGGGGPQPAWPGQVLVCEPLEVLPRLQQLLGQIQ